MQGLACLHAGLQEVGDRHGWEVWGLGDRPEASVANLQAALARRDQPFGVAVVGGHGNSKQAGVSLADGFWSGKHTNLRSLDWLLLVACAIGRLEQESQRDVEGFYAEFVAHGGRSVVAARWPIADVEAATFATEMVHQYLEGIQRTGGPAPFARARALNNARRRLLDHPDPAFHISFQLASAFDIYGLG